MYDQQSCLKAQESGSYHRTHKANSSQVRFSIPVEDLEEESDGHSLSNALKDYDKSIEELDAVRSNGSPVKFGASGTFHPERTAALRTDHPKAGSPNKIVYPASANNAEDIPTFVDYSKRINVPVPSQIWDFHNQCGALSSDSLNNVGYTTPTGSPKKTHTRNNSLQSVIVETIETYNPSVTNGTGLNLQNKPRLHPDDGVTSELYLRPDSPMNKYEVPMPLQIHIPPYLSPENKHKRRNSLIFDGTGYSVYLGDENSSVYSDDEAEKLPTTQEDVDLSEISIPSAENNLSFNVSDEDIDRKLGIDNDANVDLKKQIRNLKRQPTSAAAAKIVGEKHGRNNSKSNSIQEHNSALEILATPSKEINIPDINEIPTSTSKKGGLEFFNTFMEAHTELPPHEHSTNNVNKINPDFKFPQNDQPYESVGPTSDQDFAKVPQVSADSHIEKRRDALRQNNGHLSHSHRRSRSIHSEAEMFLPVTHTECHPEHHTSLLNPSSIPNRSPLRPSSVHGPDEIQNSVLENHTVTYSDCDEDVCEVLSEYSSESMTSSKDEFSFTNSTEGLDSKPSQHDVLKHKNLNSNIGVDRQKSIIENIPNEDRVSGLPLKPLSTIHSFANNIEDSLRIPTSTLMSEALKGVTRKVSLLDPNTCFNNVQPNSHSSYESEFSQQSYTSVATTVSSNNMKKPTNGTYVDSHSLTFLESSKRNGSDGFCNPTISDTYHGPHISSGDSETLSDSEVTILEQHDGKMVEVIVLDPPTAGCREICTTVTTPRSKRKSAEIIDLCDRTAEDVRELIINLTTSKQEGRNSDNFKERSLPPLPTHLLHEYRASGHQNTMSPEKQKKYMERLHSLHR